MFDNTRLVISSSFAGQELFVWKISKTGRLFVWKIANFAELFVWKISNSYLYKVKIRML